jgi:dipeptidase D
MSSLSNLSPAEIWKNFSDLNAIPRASKKEQRIIAFIKSYGESLGLPTMVDKVGNVIIKKPATPGMEDRVTIALQSHLDMVHQKNSDSSFDFDTQGIDMYVDGDWVKAKGTTLGADNGIGVATIMSILASKNIAHPPIEALFTIDEETGMTGAMGLTGGLMDAKIMLNLDTEDDHELTIGCAGGVDVTANGKYNSESVPEGFQSFSLTVKGLTGGHSGMDIHLGRANANKLMNRLLHHASEKYKIRISSVDGGSLRNAIPRESKAEISVMEIHAAALGEFIKDQLAVFKKEYHTTDPNLDIVIEPIQRKTSCMEEDMQNKILRAVYACPFGIYRMSPEIKGLVQTSNNIARVIIKEGEFTIQCLTRSSVDSEKMDLADTIRACFELCGGIVTNTGSYPGWTPDPDASIVKLMAELYEERYHSKPNIDAVHAGLECGILGANYPGMEMISFGPNIVGAHSPDERVQISSVQKFWEFLLEILKRVPKKQ